MNFSKIHSTIIYFNVSVLYLLQAIQLYSYTAHASRCVPSATDSNGLVVIVWAPPVLFVRLSNGDVTNDEPQEQRGRLHEEGLDLREPLQNLTLLILIPRRQDAAVESRKIKY